MRAPRAASEKLGSIASLEASHAEPPVMPWLTTTVTARMETRATSGPTRLAKRLLACSTSSQVMARSLAHFNSRLASTTSRKVSTPREINSSAETIAAALVNTGSGLAAKTVQVS